MNSKAGFKPALHTGQNSAEILFVVGWAERSGNLSCNCLICALPCSQGGQSAAEYSF